MNITVTLFAQSLSFFLFVVFTMKYVWPPLNKVLEERRKKIADGLAEAEKAHRDLEFAEKKSLELVREGRAKSKTIIDQAEQRRVEIIEAAKSDARTEGERILAVARGEIEQERQRAKDSLRNEVAALVLLGVEQVLQREVDKQTHEAALSQLGAGL